MSDNLTAEPETVERKSFVRQASRAKKTRDNLIARFVAINGGVGILAILLIFGFLLKDAIPTFKHVSLWKFLTGATWQPDQDIFGIVPLLAGSAAVTIGAVVIAVPLGIACAVYLAEIAPVRVREILKPTIEVLAGIPSVVIGFIGLTIAAPFIQEALHLQTGLTALTAAVMLGFMAVPTIITIAEDAIIAVPAAYREGSLALGSTRWETISRVIFPAAKSGVIAGCMLGVGRAVGETMTVLMVAGNASNVPEGLKGIVPFFLGSVKTMTAQIASEAPEAAVNSPHYHALFAVGLTLFLITFGINLVADLALSKGRH